MTVRRSPLDADHVELGATMRESDGWRLPLFFAGVFQEYRAYRRRSVVWDASDLGAILVSGPGAADAIRRTFTNDLDRIGPGRTQYTFLLNSAGGIVDDLLVWWVGADRFLLTPSRPAAVMAALSPAAGFDVEDLSADRALLALQGGEARDRMREIAPDLAALPPFRVRPWTYRGAPGHVATTRFGGQVGFEIHLPVDAAGVLYRRLVADGVVPAGMGMRETLRLEMGIPRHDFEIGPTVSPLELACDGAVAFDTDFPGRTALLARRGRGIRELLRTVVMDGRRIPQPGSPLLVGTAPVGRITSSNFSPRLHRGLAFAFVRPTVAAASPVRVRTPDGDVDGVLTTVPIDLEAAW